jgi:hypothetical protein
MLIGGDKSDLGNLWYPQHVAEAELRLQIHNTQHHR